LLTDLISTMLILRPDDLAGGVGVDALRKVEQLFGLLVFTKNLYDTLIAVTLRPANDHAVFQNSRFFGTHIAFVVKTVVNLNRHFDLDAHGQSVDQEPNGMRHSAVQPATALTFFRSVIGSTY
jgi:hypothetical protein